MESGYSNWRGILILCSNNSYPLAPSRVDVKPWELVVLLFSFVGFGALGFYDDLKKILVNVERTGFFGLRFLHKFAIQWA